MRRCDAALTEIDGVRGYYRCVLPDGHSPDTDGTTHATVDYDGKAVYFTATRATR
jgi:hypothetical protein